MFPLFIQYVYDKPVLKAELIGMINQGLAYVKVKSGTKIFQPDKGNLTDVNNNRTNQGFEIDFTSSTHELLTSNLGEQINTPTVAKTRNTFGSQVRKLILSGLAHLDLGQIKTALKNWDVANQELSSALENEVLKEFGIQNRNFENVDIKNIARVLRLHAQKREMTKNVMSFLEGVESGKYTDFSHSFNKREIENLISNIVKRIAVQKLTGSQLIQVASSQDDDLAFYSLQNGIVTEAECKVTMMGDFLNLLNLPEVKKELENEKQVNIITKVRAINRLLKDPAFRQKYKEELTIVTYRIPTQGYNSMDVFVIKEFLPIFLGPMIVLPPEAVVKLGAGYDYNKLCSIFPVLNCNGRCLYISDEADNDLRAIQSAGINSLSIQNRLLDISASIILHPVLYFRLITPIDSALISSELFKLFNAMEIDLKEPAGGDIVCYLDNLRKWRSAGKRNLLTIPITVNTFFALLQTYSGKFNAKYKIKINNIFVTQTVHFGLLTIPEQAQIFDGEIIDPTSNFLVNKEALKQEVFSQLVNATFDLPNDDSLCYTNFSWYNFGAALYLVAVQGVPFDRILKLFHQPVIFQYEKLFEKYLDGTGAREGRYSKRQSMLKAVSEITNDPIPLCKSQNITIEDFDSFEMNLYLKIEKRKIKLRPDLIPDVIKINKVFGSTIDGIQIDILYYYLSVIKESELFQKINKSIDFDRIPDNIVMKAIRRNNFIKEVEESEFINSSFIAKIFTSSVISGLDISSVLLKVNSKAFGVLYSQQNLQVFQNLSLLLRKSSSFFHIVTNDFLNSIIQNFAKIEFEGKIQKLKDIGDMYIIGDRKFQLVHQSFKIKKNLNNQGKRMRILDVIYNSVSKDKKICNIQLIRGFENSSIDKDRLTEEFRDLLSNPDTREFAVALSAVGITQSGYSYSPLFFSEIIPQEYISPIIQEAISHYQSLGPSFSREYLKKFQDYFQKNTSLFLGSQTTSYSYRYKDYCFCKIMYSQEITKIDNANFVFILDQGVAVKYSPSPD